MALWKLVRCCQTSSSLQIYLLKHDKCLSHIARSQWIPKSPLLSQRPRVNPYQHVEFTTRCKRQQESRSAHHIKGSKQDNLLKAKTNVRTCFHPGASSLEPNVVKGVQDEVKGRHIIGKMFTYVWPADKPGLRARVLVALGLLVGSKMVNVQVPFIFKYAVDYLNTPSNWLNMADPTATIITTATALLIGCEILKLGERTTGILRNHRRVFKNR